MITLEQVRKNVVLLPNYEMEQFRKEAKFYYKALASNRLVFFHVRELKKYHVYKVFYIMDDGCAYDMQMFFRALGYRVDKNKFEIYLPYNYRCVPQVQNARILDFLFYDGLITYDELHSVINKSVIEI